MLYSFLKKKNQQCNSNKNCQKEENYFTFHRKMMICKFTNWRIHFTWFSSTGHSCLK